MPLASFRNCCHGDDSAAAVQLFNIASELFAVSSGDVISSADANQSILEGITYGVDEMTSWGPTGAAIIETVLLSLRDGLHPTDLRAWVMADIRFRRHQFGTLREVTLISIGNKHQSSACRRDCDDSALPSTEVGVSCCKDSHAPSPADIPLLQNTISFALFPVINGFISAMLPDMESGNSLSKLTIGRRFLRISVRRRSGSTIAMSGSRAQVTGAVGSKLTRDPATFLKTAPCHIIGER